MIERIDVGPRMSQAARAGNLVFLAGQIDETAADAAGQTKVILKKIDDLLGRAGTDKNNILSATIWLSNMDDFAAMNSVWDNWVPQGHTPARACVEARLVAPQYLVEIAIVAAIRT